MSLAFDPAADFQPEVYQEMLALARAPVSQMSQRAYLAGLALQGLLADARTAEPGVEDDQPRLFNLPVLAVELADALLHILIITQVGEMK